ncbi:MAG: hypothetical protein HXS52_07745 [Theionarchaea archaeon]|nr:hypothetical protein [Theionarchaea archaeon]MBU7037811.1 hypothetical protein [Theionarchaea archaeon]
MKKMIVSVVTILFLLSVVPIAPGRISIRVLVDESRVCGWDSIYQDILIERGAPSNTNWDFSFSSEEPWAFSNGAEEIRNVASIHVKKSGTLDYAELRDYDVLIIASFEESYSSAEMDAVRQFVENGGSLLMLADADFPNNSASRAFDVIFSSQTAVIADKEGVLKTFHYGDLDFTLERALFFYVDNVEVHPVTTGVDRIALVYGVPIIQYESGTVLARTDSSSWLDTLGSREGSKQPEEEAGPFDVLLAMENVGKGRALFIGSSISFWNAVTQDEKQNLKLLSNAVTWLGEPGGPYKQYQTTNDEAQHIVAEATSLYYSHEFLEAETRFREALAFFEESNEIFPNVDAREGIEDVRLCLTMCGIGMQAEEIHANATRLFTEREYEKAIEEFEKAKSLYDEIECTARADECAKKIDESISWITLRNKAAQELQQAEEALSVAPSTFDAAGYEQAKRLFLQAKSSWEEYDDPVQVTACEEYIEQCETERGRIRSRVVMVEATSALVLVVLSAMIAFIHWHRKKVKQPAEPNARDALAIVSERYVRGEITKAEYEEMMSTLKRE